MTPPSGTVRPVVVVESSPGRVPTGHQPAAEDRSGPPRPAPMPALDGLRGLAVAAVLAFHTGHFGGGFLGVDLFFALSGFLITSLLVAEHGATGRIDLGRFWARRARRLLPALVVVLAAVAAYAAFAAGPGELAAIRRDALATVGYVANWEHIVGGASVVSPFAVLSPLEHTWSLAIEEQFYLLWPLLVLAVLGLTAGSRRWLLGCTVVMTVASAVSMALWYRPSAVPPDVYFRTDSRAASILVGAVLALVTALRGPAASRGGRVAVEIGGLAGAGVLAAAWTFASVGDAWLYEGGLALCAVAASLVVAAAAQPRGGPLAAILSMAPLRALGLVSYGLYLWHWPVYIVADGNRTGLAGWSLNGARVAISLTLAVVSYFAVERPVRRGAFRGRAAWVAAAASVAAVLAGIVVATHSARPA